MDRKWGKVQFRHNALAKMRRARILACFQAWVKAHRHELDQRAKADDANLK